jgi:haloalkane dehalogenase
MQMDYMASLQAAQIPKLLLHATPGVLVPEAAVAWWKANLPNCDTVNVGAGTHYIQEDHPHEIGAAISTWMQTNKL